MTGKLDGELASRVKDLQRLAHVAEDAARTTRGASGTTDSAAASTARAELEAAGHLQITVLVRVDGDLEAAERAGLWTEFRTDQIAVGTIAVADLESVAAVPNVVAIQSDRQLKPLAAPPQEGSGETLASEAVDRGQGVGARSVPPLPSGFTGAGVVVGIIDTGVDIYHPAFIWPGTNPPRTRIVSLYDESLRQTIECTGNPTGSVVLWWRAPKQADEHTGSLAFPLQAATVQTALEGFNSIDPGDVAVTGGPLPAKPIEIDFTGIYDGSIIDPYLLPMIRAVPTFTGGTHPGIKVRRGRFITQDEINAALAASPRKPFVSRDLNGHGTEVAGIAAGEGKVSKSCCKKDQPIGLAPGADLVIIKASTDAQWLKGATHVFEQPWLASGKKPAVVNLSQGQLGTAGDGTSNADIGLDDLLAGTTRRAVVAAAGNEGARVIPASEGGDFLVPTKQPGGGQHTRGHLPAGGPASIRFIIDFGDTRTNFFHLWYEGPGRLSVNLTAPPNAPGAPDATTGPSLPNVVNPEATADPAGPPFRTEVLGGTGGHPVSHRYALAESPSGKRHFTLTLNPVPDAGVSMGTWTFSLQETAGSAVTFDAWFTEDPRDPPGRFHPDEQDQSRTICSPGTARQVITVGAFNTDDNHLHPMSSRGPTTDLRFKPELCAPGVLIVSAKSGGTTPNDLYTSDSGTSMAAPYVAGVVALMFQMNPHLDHGTIAAQLMATCDKPVPPVPPGQLDSGWGAGRVNPEKAVAAVKPPPLAAIAAATTDEEPIVLPAAAYPAARVPFTHRVRAVQDRLVVTPAGQLLATLVARHQDEVQRLVMGERRVTIAWHRMHGPLLVRLLLYSELRDDIPVPRLLGGKPLAEGLDRLLDELDQAGSPALRAAIAEHRASMLALPGARLSELDVPVSGVS
ncbi:S8 family serine peptidase [Streptomyces pseudogriseolus]|uniref:S8 family serine peptidase n=1 Tax=Streptomyces pseudogriseolus TaxID=36817 RepID=UPI003FA20B6B